MFVYSKDNNIKSSRGFFTFLIRFYIKKKKQQVFNVELKQRVMNFINIELGIIFLNVH